MTVAAPASPRRLYRATGGRPLGGVAAGLGEHLGLAPTVLRLAFAALALAGGLGIVLYAVFWVVVPQREGATDDSPHSRTQLAAVGALVAGGLLLLNTATGSSAVWTLVPGGAALTGLALVWRQADESQRARWRATANGPGGLLRAGGGSALVVLGILGFFAGRGELAAARDGLLLTAVVVTGLAVLTAPFWLRMTADLRLEQRERIRSQERAEVAAHVHDSVLQTLALIQKATDDPTEVTRLARAQERELRGWLYRPASPTASVAVALEQAAAEVEEAHRTPVEVVVVGDCPADARMGALVAAAREAMVNSAAHSGAAQVQVYAEVEPSQVTVYVRDRGCGFDPSAVPADRYGLAQSVVGRMGRNGGRAVVRSSPGEGTEVRLEVPRG